MRPSPHPSSALSPPRALPPGGRDAGTGARRRLHAISRRLPQRARGHEPAAARRFLMPGSRSSPALTFAPLDLPSDGKTRPGSLAAMMERRFEAYKVPWCGPFFREHFARLDRANRAGGRALRPQCRPCRARRSGAALDSILTSFRLGRNSIVSTLFPTAHRARAVRRHQGGPSPPHEPRPAGGHPPEARRTRAGAGQGRRRAVRCGGAFCGAGDAGSHHDPQRRSAPRHRRHAGGRAGGAGHTFDGDEEVGVFPATCRRCPMRSLRPEARAFRGLSSTDGADTDFRFLRFRPPAGMWRGRSASPYPAGPALQFLLGDRLA